MSKLIPRAFRSLKLTTRALIPISNSQDLSNKFYSENLQKVLGEFAKRHTEIIQEPIPIEASKLEDKDSTILARKKDNLISLELGKKTHQYKNNYTEIAEIIKKTAEIKFNLAGEIIEAELFDEKEFRARELYYLVCEALSSSRSATNLSDERKNIVARAINSAEQNYSAEKLQELWQKNSPLYMRLLSNTPNSRGDLSELAIIFNNSLYHGKKFVDPIKITVGKNFDREKYQKILADEIKNLDEKGLTLDLETGGAVSVASFRKLIMSNIYQGIIGPESKSATPNSCEKTSIPFKTRSATIVSKASHSNLFHLMRSPPLDFAGTGSGVKIDYTPKGVGIIIDPQDSSSVFTHASTHDMRSDHASKNHEENLKIFKVETFGFNDSDFRFNDAKSADDILHKIISSNLSSDWPFHYNYGKIIGDHYGKERNFFWNEICGTYSSKGVIGIVMLDLSPQSAEYALELSYYYHSEKPIVRYSYLRNQLVPVDLQYLENIAKTKSSNVNIAKNLHKIFLQLGVDVKIEIDSKNNFIITANPTTALFHALGIAGNLFFETPNFYKKEGNRATFSVEYSQLVALEDLIAEASKTKPELIQLTNDIFTLYDYENYFKKRCLAPIDGEEVDFVEFGAYQKTVNHLKIHPETPCFAFLHPTNSNVECLTLVQDKTNHCLFFDKSTDPKQFLGEAFHPLLQERPGEYSRGFAWDIALQYPKGNTFEECAQWVKDNKAMIDNLINHRIKTGITVNIDGSAIAINFNDKTSFQCFQKFIGENFDDNESELGDAIAFGDYDKCRLRPKEEIIGLQNGENYFPYKAIRSNGWRYNDKNEIEIIFDKKQHRDNFIRAFNGDVITEDTETTPFAIDAADSTETKLVIRKEFVEMLEKIDAHHGRKKSLNLFLDLSRLNNAREINFSAMAAQRPSQACDPVSCSNFTAQKSRLALK